jgi:hypothetical protein
LKLVCAGEFFIFASARAEMSLSSPSTINPLNETRNQSGTKTMSYSISSTAAPVSFGGACPLPTNGAGLPVVRMSAEIPARLQHHSTFFCPWNGYWKVPQVRRVIRPMSRSNVVQTVNASGNWKQVERRNKKAGVERRTPQKAGLLMKGNK